MLLGRSLSFCWICLLLFSSTFGVPVGKDGVNQMAPQSPPGPPADQHSVQKSPPGIQYQNVNVQNYGSSRRAPTSGTGQKPSRDLVVSHSQESTGPSLNSAGLSYQAAPVSHYQPQHGYEVHYRGDVPPGQVLNSEQQAGGSRQQSVNSYLPYMAHVGAARGVHLSDRRFPPLQQSYIVQSEGGYMHAREEMAHSKYDPHDHYMYPFGPVELPNLASLDLQGQSGDSAPGVHQAGAGSMTVVQNPPVSSTGYSQHTGLNSQRVSQNPSSHQVSHHHGVPAYNFGVGPVFGPQGLYGKFPNLASGPRNTQQSQGFYGAALQELPVSLQHGQQNQRNYQSAVLSRPDTFAQGYRQKS